MKSMFKTSENVEHKQDNIILKFILNMCAKKMLKLSLVINSHTNTFHRVKSIQFLRNFMMGRREILTNS